MANRTLEAPLLLKQASGDLNQQLAPQNQQIELQELQDILSHISKQLPTRLQGQSNPSSQGAQSAPSNQTSQSQFFLPRLPKDSNFLKFIQLPEQRFVLANETGFKIKEARAMPRGPEFKVTDGRITCLVSILKKDNTGELVFGDSLGNLVRFSYPACKMVKSFPVSNGPVNRLAISGCLYSAGDKLIKFNEDWDSEVINDSPVLDLEPFQKNLAFCSLEGIWLLNDSKLLISNEMFEKVALQEEIIAAGRYDLLQVWKVQDQEVTPLKKFLMSSAVKSLKLANSRAELGVLNDQGEVKIWKLDEDLKPKVLSLNSGIRDVVWNESLSEIFFISSDSIDKFILREWTDEYFIKLPNKIISFYLSFGHYAWLDESGLTFFAHDRKESNLMKLAKPASKILVNSSFVFAVFAGIQVCKVPLSEFSGTSEPVWVDVSKAEENTIILDFAADDIRLVYALSNSKVLVVGLASNEVTLTIDLTLRGRQVPLSNLQIFPLYFYVSNEASMFKIPFENPGLRETCFVDWQGKIKLAKVSPDQVIILKSEPPAPDASLGSGFAGQRLAARGENEKIEEAEGSKANRKTRGTLQAQPVVQSSNIFKLYYPGRQKFVKEFSFHSGPISNFEFTPDNLYFLVSSEDCKISLWSRETLSLITYINYLKPIINFSITTDLSKLFIVHLDEIAVMNSPVNPTSFQIIGPDLSKEYDVFNYFKKIAENSGKEEGSRITFSPYAAEMDNYVITPSLASPVHFYAGFQYYDAYFKALLNNSSFHNTRLGLNPLYLMLWRDEQDPVIKTINSKCVVAETNPFVFGFVNSKTLVEMNKRGYPGCEAFYEAVYQQFNKIGLPKYASSEESLPMVVYSDFLEPNKNRFLKEEQYKIENFPIMFHSSCIKINMIPGSQESLNLLKSFADCPNQEIFTKPFIKILLVEKWKRVKWMMLIQGGAYLAYIICLMGFIVFYSNVNEVKEVESSGSSTTSTVFLLLGQAINFILAIYEVYQMVQLKSEYFKDIWNYVDVIRFLSYTILMIIILSTDSNLIDSKFFLLLEVLVILLTWIRGLTFFRLFDSVRYLTALIFEVMYDMLSFTVLAGYSLVGLSLMLFACTDSTKDDKYYEFLGFTYMTTIGEYNSFGKDIQEFASLGVTIFTLTSIINTIVMMNLLISIIGDTFDRVQQGRNVTDFKELISMIYEMETLLNWARDEKQGIYLQRLSVRFGTGEEVGVWEGRVRELMKVINSVRFDVKSSLRMLVNDKVEDEAASTEIKKRIQDLERKHDQDMKEVKDSLKKICGKLGI